MVLCERSLFPPRNIEEARKLAMQEQIKQQLQMLKDQVNEEYIQKRFL